MAKCSAGPTILISQYHSVIPAHQDVDVMLDQFHQSRRYKQEIETFNSKPLRLEDEKLNSSTELIWVIHSREKPPELPLRRIDWEPGDARISSKCTFGGVNLETHRA